MKRLLKILSFVGVLAFVLPLTLFFRNLIFLSNGNVPPFLISVATAIVGFVVGGAVNKDMDKDGIKDAKTDIGTVIGKVKVYYKGDDSEKSEVKGKGIRITLTVAYVSVLLVIMLGCLIYFNFGLLRMLFETSIMAILYIIGIKANINDYRYSLSNKKIYFGIVVISAIIIAGWILGGSFNELRSVFYIFASIFMLISLIIKNQSYLYDAFTSRVTDSGSIPRRIQIYNLGIIIVLFISIVILFNSEALVRSLLPVIKSIVIFIIRGILWLMSIFASGSELGAEAPPGTKPDLPPADDGGTNEVLRIISIIVVIIIVLILLYKVTPIIIAKAKEVIKKIVLFIIKVFKKIFEVKSQTEVVGETEYYDEVEVIKPVESSRKKVQRKKYSNFKKKLKKIIDPVERVRFTYSFLIRTLINAGVEIKEYDTPRVICAKVIKEKDLSEVLSGLKLDPSSINTLTRLYERVRYGEECPKLEDVYKFEEIYLCDK